MSHRIITIEREYASGGREIGEMMGVPANYVTAWMAKARAYLKAEPRFVELYKAV